ncbi:MAG: hypothetical protein H7257_09665 [Taibaiella sp.]|nr:hypothetical protein [Taibaiella sp.]
MSWTIGLHALLLLLFFLLQYSVPLKETVDMGSGLEVNLGTSDNGSGTSQPQKTEDPSAYSATVEYKDMAKKAELPKDIVRSDAPDATDISNPEKLKNTAKPVTGAEHATTPAPTPRYVYQGGTGKGGNSAQQNVAGTGEGITTGPGDQGVPGGTPGASNYTGNGGIGHNLGGRSIAPDRFEAEFHEGGKVVIHVTVDRDGNIVSKFVKSSSSQELTKLALDKLNKARFSKSTGTEPQQFGDVTIVFKAR